MNGRMTNAPIYYALIQARFNPISMMAEFAGQIQDILRRQGYTLFEPHTVTQLQVISGPGQVPTKPEINQITTWLITKSDRTSGFILGTDSLAFHTTHYQTRNEFLPEIISGLRAVHDVVQLEHVSRLGLRYLEAVLPGQNETVDDYLTEGLKGVQFDAAVHRYSLAESVFETSMSALKTNGTLVTRVHRATAQLGYPPDMIPNGLVPLPRFSNVEVIPHAVIDTDHFVEEIISIDFEMIRNLLISLHAGVKQVFEATVSAHAREVWGLSDERD